MDLELRTADLDLDPGLGAPHLAISAVQVARMADVVAELRSVSQGSPPGGLVGVAAFASLDRVEPLAFYVGALVATVPGLGSPLLSPGTFRFADAEVLRGRLEHAGLTKVRVRPVTRPMWFASGRQLLDTVARSDATAERRLGELTGRQVRDLEAVLDGMLRERSGGPRGAVLGVVVNVGSGRTATPSAARPAPPPAR